MPALVPALAAMILSASGIQAGKAAPRVCRPHVFSRTLKEALEKRSADPQARLSFKRKVELRFSPEGLLEVTKCVARARLAGGTVKTTYRPANAERAGRHLAAKIVAALGDGEAKDREEHAGGWGAKARENKVGLEGGPKPPEVRAEHEPGQRPEDEEMPARKHAEGESADAGAEHEHEAEEEEPRFGARIALKSFAGVGPLRGGRSYFSTALAIEPEIALAAGVSAFAELSIFAEWSHRGPYRAQDSIDDTALGLRWEAPELGPAEIEAEVLAFFPTSPEARAVGNVMTLAANAELELEHRIVESSLMIYGMKFLPTIDPEELVPREPLETPCFSSVRNTCPFFGELPPNYKLGVEIGAKLELIEDLTASIYLEYAFTKFAEGEHETEARIEIAYRIFEAWFINIGMLTVQPLIDEEGRVRFPFVDVVTPERNNTAVYLGLAFVPGRSS